MANSSETGSVVRSDLRQGWSDAWHLWRVSCRDDRLPVGSFGEWYGGAIVGGAGCTKNSSSIRMTVIRNLSPRSRHRARRPAYIISRAAGHLLREASCHDAAMMEVINISAPRMIVCKASEIEFSKLRITRSYIKLSCIPEGAAKIVSLAHLGNYEVRMLECLQNDFDATPLFSIDCSITTHNYRSTVVAALTSTREQLRSELLFRDEVRAVLRGEPQR